MPIPAVELEAAVAACLASALDEPLELCARMWIGVVPADIGMISQRPAEQVAGLRQRERSALRVLVSKVCVHDDCVVVECDTGALAGVLSGRLAEGAPLALELVPEVCLQRSGRALRLVHPSGTGLDTSPSASLIRLLLKARRWWATLRKGEIDLTRLAAREGVTASYMTRVVRLAFLSPRVVEGVLAGSTKVGVDREMLTATNALSSSWSIQGLTLLAA